MLAAAAMAMVIATLAGACGQGERRAETGGVSDTTAYRGASTLTDSTAQLAALEKFVRNYPESAFRGRAFRRLCDLKAAKDPNAAAGFARRALRKEKQSGARSALYYVLFEHALEHEPRQVEPLIGAALADEADLEYGLFNAMAWDLGERGEHLEQALALADRGLGAAPDSLARAVVLDTKGWIRYQQQDYDRAIADLTAAVALSPEPYEEIEIHLAKALDAGGKTAEARAAYLELLLKQEDPEFRARLAALTTELGGTAEEAMRDLDRQREERATPAPELELKNYAGESVRLSSFRGQVVLLNFWHPT